MADGRRASVHAETATQARDVAHAKRIEQERIEKNRLMLKSLKDHQVEHAKHLQELQGSHANHQAAHAKHVEHFQESMPKIAGELQELRGSLNATIQSVVNSMIPPMIQNATRSLETELASLKQQVQQLTAGQPRSMEPEITSLKQQIQKLTAENQKMSGEVTKIQKLTADSQKVGSEVEKMRTQMQKAEKMVQDMERTKKDLEKSKKEQADGLKEVKECAKSIKTMKDELQKLKGDSASKKEIEQLKAGMNSKDVLTRVQSKLDLTTIEFNELKQKIYDRGLLAPPRMEPINEESPPVGTVELCEDVFTAQLLMRLTFDKQVLTELAAGEKAKREMQDENYEALGPAQREMRLVQCDESDSDYEMSAAEMFALEQFGNVAGISEPEEGVNREHVIPVWTAVSFITLILQLVVVSLMMQFYIMTPGCFDVIPEPFVDPNWWVLHVSRGLAMFVCGAIMTRDFMDALNYLMTSILLEPHMNATVLLSFIGRVMLNVLLVMANIYLYMSFTAAGYLWVNMACLGFIATLDRDVLSLAKRGVFGHQIGKAVTGVKYEITFLHEYPAWFPAVSKTTITVCIGGVTIAAVLCFLQPDRTC